MTVIWNVNGRKSRFLLNQVLFLEHKLQAFKRIAFKQVLRRGGGPLYGYLRQRLHIHCCYLNEGRDGMEFDDDFSVVEERAIHYMHF